MAKIEACLQPIKIGNLTAVNRFVMAAQHTGYSDGGSVNQQAIDFYVERARGETGVIITGAFVVEKLGLVGTDCLYIDEDRHVEPLRRLANAIRPHGSLSVVQLIHSGRYARQRWTGAQAITATGGPTRLTGEVARTMTTEEVEAMVEAFADGARRAQDAGFDMVEVQASTGYLVNQFISPATNKREDKYGGSFENRMRFPIEILERIHANCGAAYPVLFRICGSEFVEGGYDQHDAAKVAAVLAKAGAVAIDVQIGWHEAAVPTVASSVPRAGFAHIAAEIKNNVDVPVIGCNRINDPFVAEELVASGKCDMVAMARAMLAEPLMVKKAREGRFDEINSCIACCTCLNELFADRIVHCGTNFRTGREGEFPMTAADRSKRVVVVGGGPGGMEAARIAAQRGHRVTLHEAADALGGQLNISSVPPYKEEMKNFLRYMSTQVERCGVNVVLGQRVEPADLAQGPADVVIVATGARPVSPNVPTAKGADVSTAWDVLAGQAVGQNVVVIGGGQVGCETALHIAARGSKVTVVEMLPRLCVDMGPTTRWVMMAHLKAAGVAQLADAKVTEVAASGVAVTRKDGSTATIPADTVVMAVGARSENKLAAELEGKVNKLVVIGDAAAPHTMREAIADGFQAGYNA